MQNCYRLAASRPFTFDAENPLWLLLAIAWIFSTTAGCSDSPLVQPVPRDTVSWDALFLSDAKIGHSTTRISRLTENGRQLVRISNETEMTIKRFGQTTLQRLVFSSVETPEGEIVRFRSEVSSGNTMLVTKGSLENGRLQLATVSQGKRQESSLAWDKSWGGFFAVEQSLSRKPMQPGEKRTVKSLQPVLNQAGETQLVASDREKTDLLSGTQKLLKIKSTAQLGTVKIETLMWTNENGEVLKTFQQTLKQVSYRTTKKVALLPNDPSGFDLGLASIVKTKPLANAHQTKRVVYRAKLPSGDPENIFPVSAAQSIKAIDQRTVDITVHRIAPNQPAKLEMAVQKPVDADLTANNLIQSDDRLITEMAGQVSKTETDPWKLALKLERHVHDKIEKKDFSQAFATAAEVAKSLQGDCTEHAVLLTALCRARKIPARVAIGLVYYEQQSGFAYHMWTEVWIRDRWIPLDATLGRGGIGAAHLKLVDSHLQGASAYSVFLPVVEVLGQLKLEIIEVE